MGDFLKDIRLALRGIRRNPAPSLAVIITLALGIGPATAVFSAVYGVLLRPLPYEDPENLVRLRHTAADGGPVIGFNIPELADYNSRATAMSGLVEYHTLWFNLIENSIPERVQTGVVSWNYFEVLGVRPLHGRVFRAADDEIGAPRTLVLSHEYWMRRFGGDPDIVGRVVEMNQQPHTIIGVLPRIPRYPNSSDDVYMPGSACPFRTPAWLNNRQARAVLVFGRVHEGHSMRQAESQLNVASRVLQAEFPQSYPAGRTFGISATPLLEELTTGANTTLWVIFGTGAFLLLIVCANVANLTLARVLNRDRDLALMTALGARQSLIARQMLIESTILALAGGAIGVLLALMTRGMLADFAARFSPRASDVAIDGPVLLFALAASVGTGLLLGAVPAWPRKRNLASALREGAQKGSAGGIRVRSLLVVGQVALSFVLLIGAGLMLRSLVRLQSVESGFEPARVLSMRIDLDFSRYTPQGRARAGLTDSGPSPQVFWSRVLDELPLLQGVESRGLASNVPFGGGLPQLQFGIRGRETVATSVTWNVVSDGYVQTTGMRLLSGRDFTPADRQGTPGVALVSASLARQHWGNESPIGSFIATNPQNPQANWLQVVGVVSDVRPDGPAGAETPVAYIPLRQAGALGSTLLVKTTGDPKAAVESVREAVRRVDANQPVAFIQTLAEARSNSVASQRLTTTLLALLAVLALLISAAGIAGVMAYAVAQRTREIGIRLALGATPWEVRWMVLRQALMLIGAGVAVGTVGALALSRFLASLLFQQGGADPLTYIAVALLFATVGGLAAAAPAVRSSQVDPLRALRAE